jgi:ethanolamine transporter
MEVMKVVASIGIILLGTFPILSVAVRALDRPLNSIGRKIGMDAASTAGLVISLANSIPVYKMMKNMSARGKVVNTAWLVPATAALGDHLGFTAGIRPDMIAPVVLGKLSAGILAVILALVLTKEDSSIEN